ncbi:hypothetical protein GOD71_30605 [Sinorhizobium medicae]|nr:hypothetical protein [Sinorhizobium medicae]MDX0506473.1 hypothetical protein [Sinorhizobium medicae]MDX0592906.1 hypothetical protein [Sinorhizobium medicae]MDX0648948.1 hypothetical protein [Sinorhizobium medicae]MDX0741789.1 hypothetical protein [Sinorhizobium medicae]
MAINETAADAGIAFISKRVEDLRSIAPKEMVKAELRTLLATIDCADEDLLETLCTLPHRVGVLEDLQLWNSRTAHHPNRDRIGAAAARFWVAQTLATGVLREDALRPDVAPDERIAAIMKIGADGLIEVGQSQFERVATLAVDLVDWLGRSGHSRIAVLESPLGNSLVTQAFCDIAASKAITLTPVVWNAPRNDRPSRGRTVGQSAKQFASDTKNFDLIVYLDDVISGSRFIKLHDALLTTVGKERLLSVAMVFHDPNEKTDPKLRERLRRRLGEQMKRIGAPTSWVTFPKLRIFFADGGNQSAWQTPVIWGESDLIAGKRKVNLVFTLLDHFFEIMEDLGSRRSRFRPFLELAWRTDTSGSQLAFPTDFLEASFRKYAKLLQSAAFKAHMWKGAIDRFEKDYSGEIQWIGSGGVKERIDWIHHEFLEWALAHVNDHRIAHLVWNAIDAVFVTAFPFEKPRPSRDQDATPYTIDFNVNLKALNRHLRQRIVEMAASYVPQTASYDRYL